MDFENVGRKCEYSNCNTIDFLPFYCNSCHKYYCLQHKDYSSHQCDNDPFKSKLVKSKSKSKKVKSKKYICNYPNCKETNIVEILCVNCKKHYCLKHRFKELHGCYIK